VGVQVPLSALHFKRLIGFGLDLIQLVNLVWTLWLLQTARDRTPFFEPFFENKALPPRKIVQLPRLRSAKLASKTSVICQAGLAHYDNSSIISAGTLYFAVAPTASIKTYTRTSRR
jgi:hypothetical protein